MDADSPNFSQDVPLVSASAQSNGDSTVDNSNLPATCTLCGRNISPGNEVTDELESCSLCGDCKFLFLEDLETPTQDSYQRQQARGRRIGYGSSESIENLFSQQFSHMINLVRQNQSPVPGHEDQPVDGDPPATVFPRTSARTTPSGSRRWRRVLSDTESDGFDNSVYGESESNMSFGQYRIYHGESDAISFSAYGEDSDVSVDGHSIIMDTDIFIQSGNRSDVDSDTDIDPMHVGMDQWNSDDSEEAGEEEEEEEEEEDGEWEEADAEEDEVAATEARAQDRNFFISSPSESNGSINWHQRFHSPEFEGVIRWRFREGNDTITRNIFASLEEPELTAYTGNSGDYLDARGFEELLEHLAETDMSRRGAPPASISFVNNLPRVIVKEEHEKHDGLACAICKDVLTIGAEVNQLPCLHLYHPSCILPWLSARNSCPLCRYELPTDDKDYEEGKQNSSNRVDTNVTEQQDASDDNSSDVSVEIEADGVWDYDEGGRELQVVDSATNSSGREGGRGRWFFLAAAPIFSLVGIVLVLWLGNPLRAPASSCNFPEVVHPQIRMPGSSSASQRENRNRRWWSFF